LVWLKTEKLTDFSAENEAHVDYLKDIWKILTTHEECKFEFACVEDEEFQTTSNFWKYFGFQSPNPKSDLRAGLLPLIQLRDFCQRRPEAVFWIMDSLRQFELRDGKMVNTSKHNYPFAPVGISITQELCKQFHIISESGKAKQFSEEYTTFWPLCEHFQDLYEYAFQLFHLEWMNKKRTYFDFPFAIKEFREQLGAKLKSWSPEKKLRFDDALMPNWNASAEDNGDVPHWDTDV